eukprot:jgi/Undpi1/10739/HiC_scaffold_29.g13187.m1
MQSAGGSFSRGAIKALGLRGVGGSVNRLSWDSFSVCQSLSTSAQDEENASTRARDRARAAEWESDDQRLNRWRSGGRYQRSRNQNQKKRDKTWQNSDPHEDLCRIKWEPDPTTIPDNWFRGHVPDLIKRKMFEVWQQDPVKNSAMSLAKRYGLPYLDVQAILTMKQSAKEKVEAGDGYEIYPEIEELMVERKEAFIEDLGQHYGQTIPFIYEHCPDIDKNEPSTWATKEFKIAKLTEKDKNDMFDCPPLKSQDEVAADLKYKRTNKAIYASVRDEKAAELTKKLAEAPKLAKKRWAFAMKDTSTKDTARAPIVLRDGDGVMRGATVSEEMGLSYADENLFRRDVRRSTALRQME